MNEELNRVLLDFQQFLIDTWDFTIHIINAYITILVPFLIWLDTKAYPLDHNKLLEYFQEYKDQMGIAVEEQDYIDDYIYDFIFYLEKKNSKP